MHYSVDSKMVADSFDLQRFAGGQNLTCQTCSYFGRDGRCELHGKRAEPKGEACSHYQAKKHL